jgi:aryl-alcohol dehydrogenase-like predicted oxidoreductase
MEEIVRAFDWLINAGKAFYWGTSEWSAQQLQEAHEVAAKHNLIGPSAEQPHYSMMHRERFEVEYNPCKSISHLEQILRPTHHLQLVFRKYKMGTTTWSPLDSGMLTGKYNDGIPEDSRYATNKEFFAETVKKLQSPEGQAKIDQVKRLTALAEKELGCSMTHLALAWVIKNENVSTCILGASKPEQIVDNLKALDVLPKLTPDVMQLIEDILDNKPTHPVSGFGTL